MIFRKHAWVSALVFLCTILSAGVSVWAEDDDGTGSSLGFAALPSAVADQFAGVKSVPFSATPIEPAQYNGDVRDLPPDYTVRDYYHHWNEFPRPIPQRTIPPGTDMNMPVAPPVVNAPMPSSTSFAGLAFNTSVTGGSAGAGWPPDTNGDVGPVYYIQSVNDAFGIFNKSTGVMTAAFTENQLWSGAGTGTACDANNQGDPVVIHDGAADRWILSQFAFTSSFSGAHYQCIAVSKTSDPVSGGWWLYAVRTDIGGSGPPANSLLDYPKFGVWTDCLYMGGNVFTNSTTYGGGAYATFSRTALFAGTALSGTNSAVGYTANANIFGMFPATLSGTGTSPPAGTQEYFVVQSATVFGYDVRKYVQGANTCGSGGSLSALTTVNEAVYAYPSDASFNTDLVAQPTPGNKLDSLGDEIMQRVVYRNISGAESLWLTHTTCGSTVNPADGFTCNPPATSQPMQVQWSQINVTGGTIATTPVQQQIYAPDTTFYRWMPSLAVDKQGNMAIGYSRSNGTAGNYPTIAYSGRLAGDAANQLPETETVMVAGGGAQSNSCGGACTRWGDYSAMTIDPVDDCTFWFTSEYYDTVAHGASGTWQTRIGSFKFPSCVSVGAASKLAFTQQPNASYASNATITVKVSVEDASGNVVTTDTSNVTVALTTAGGATLGGTKTVAAVNGVATFSNLTVDKVGTYTLTATDGALTSAVSSSFNITAGAASKVVFTQQPNASYASNAAITVKASIEDAASNVVTTDTSNVTVALTTAGGATLGGTKTVAAVAGVATFSNLTVDKVGTYTLTATDGVLTSGVSSSFNITAGAASKVVFTTQPNASYASNATIAVAASVEDAAGNVVTTDTSNVTVALTTAGGATLGGTKTVAAVGGVATFGNLTVDKTGTYTLTATDGVLTSGVSSSFNITAGAATKVVFTTQPNASYASNAAIGVGVSVEDAAGNVVTTDTSNVTVALTTAGGATLGGTKTVAAVNGVATFSNLTVDKVGTYTLTATDGVLTSGVSSSFNITAGAAAKVVFTTQPNASYASNAAIGVGVSVEDAAGNVVTTDTSNVTVALTSAGGATLGGTKTVAAVNGVATFANLTVDKVGTYTLTATDGVLTSGVSSSFNITAGAAAKVVFTTQPPASRQSNATFSTAVSVEDAAGNVVTTNTSNVTVALTTAGGATLGGTTTVAAVNGVATFGNLSVDKVGTYTLTATDGLLTQDVSAAFNITPGVASKLVFTAQPPATAQTNSGFGAAVSVEDAAGNVVTSNTSNVTVALTTAGGATLNGTKTVAAVNGVATFANLSIDTIGTYTLTATDSTLTAAVSSSILVTPGSATKLAFTVQPPASAQSNATFSVTVSVEDATGNVVTSDGSSVTVALTTAGGATLGGTKTVAAVNGVATFANLSVDKVGTYTLTASDGLLTPAVSSSFSITAGAASKLVFTAQPPASSTSNTAFGATVTVQDAAGNTVTTDTSTVTLALTGGTAGAALTGGSVAAVNGVATFSNLKVDKAGTNYVLNASDGVLTGAASSNFNITAGAPAAISFSTQPVTSAAGATIPVVAHVQDAAGNPIVGDNVTLAFGNNAGGSTLTVSANPVATDASGNATFAGVSLNKAATGYTLKVTEAVNSLNVTSNAFDITAGAATQLVFTTQPTDVVRGTTLATVVVTEKDANGNVVPDNSNVGFAVSSCGGSPLGGVAMSNGVATLNSTQRFYTLGSGLTVTASTGALNATSATFNVTSGADFIYADSFEACRP